MFDIENSPSSGLFYELWKEGNIVSIEKQWYLLSFAYKWLGEKKTHVISLPDFKLYKKDKENDRDLVKALHEIMSEADVVIAHNGNNFDIKKSNARFIFHGLKPTTPFKSIDTLQVARRYFQFTSNRLNDLGVYLGLGKKLKTGGFDTWKGCMNGDMKAWKLMCEYNKQDVVLLEKIYLTMLPWIQNHPNVNILDERVGACPNCASTKIIKRGYGITLTTKYPRYRCTDCGRWSRGKAIKTEVVIR